MEKEKLCEKLSPKDLNKLCIIYSLTKITL